MNREIKYKYYVVRENGFVFSRVFDIREIEFGLSENWLEVNHAGDISKVLKRCQYIGLKDKNGVEIYEGDILQDYQGLNRVINIISTHQGIGHNWRIQMIKECEVIGNIYENPELLNK